MKRLILLRHGKAVPTGSGPDHDRDLEARGRADAAWAGNAIAAAGWVPDVALVSDAARTQQTFAAALPHLAASPELRVEPALYDATVDEILACIATAGAAACLLVIGHNPGIAQTALRLAPRSPSTQRTRLSQGFPTAALVLFSADIADWSQLAQQGATLDDFLTPG